MLSWMFSDLKMDINIVIGTSMLSALQCSLQHYHMKHDLTFTFVSPLFSLQTVQHSRKFFAEEQEVRHWARFEARFIAFHLQKVISVRYVLLSLHQPHQPDLIRPSLSVLDYLYSD
jgi:hypothetical protein